nr:hypothetical protein HmN_000947300 [Hymenolepis microstoma]
MCIFTALRFKKGLNEAELGTTGRKCREALLYPPLWFSLVLTVLERFKLVLKATRDTSGTKTAIGRNVYVAILGPANCVKSTPGLVYRHSHVSSYSCVKGETLSIGLDVHHVSLLECVLNTNYVFHGENVPLKSVSSYRNVETKGSKRKLSIFGTRVLYVLERQSRLVGGLVLPTVPCVNSEGVRVERPQEGGKIVGVAAETERNVHLGVRQEGVDRQKRTGLLITVADLLGMDSENRHLGDGETDAALKVFRGKRQVITENSWAVEVVIYGGSVTRMLGEDDGGFVQPRTFKVEAEKLVVKVGEEAKVLSVVNLTYLPQEGKREG